MEKINSIVISNITNISAIYFGLLQSGYDYYSIGRNAEYIEAIQRWQDNRLCPEFFFKVKQNTCEVYPYWPRAAILETASFYLAEGSFQFEEFHALYERIMSAGNITDNERDQSLWAWMAHFPDALCEILSNDTFINYLAWEREWITNQNTKYEKELQLIQRCVETCVNKYNSPVRDIQIVINPIKCIYSADYHLHDNCFVFCSGEFNTEFIIHEFLHHVIHPVVIERKKTILENNDTYWNIDASYYLSGNDEGRLNAFEEYAVRKLSLDIIEEKYPIDIITYLEALM